MKTNLSKIFTVKVPIGKRQTCFKFLKQASNLVNYCLAYFAESYNFFIFRMRQNIEEIQH